MAQSRAATVLAYTEKEQAAIEALRNAGEPMTAKDLGVSTGTLQSLITKMGKFPADAVVISKEKRPVEVVVVKEQTFYSID